MNEKVYKTMNNIGIMNLVLGICTIILAIGVGVTSIVAAAKLLKEKKSLMF